MRRVIHNEFSIDKASAYAHGEFTHTQENNNMRVPNAASLWQDSPVSKRLECNKSFYTSLQKPPATINLWCTLAYIHINVSCSASFSDTNSNSKIKVADSRFSTSVYNRWYVMRRILLTRGGVTCWTIAHTSRLVCFWLFGSVLKISQAQTFFKDKVKEDFAIVVHYIRI